MLDILLLLLASILAPILLFSCVAPKKPPAQDGEETEAEKTGGQTARETTKKDETTVAEQTQKSQMLSTTMDGGITLPTARETTMSVAPYVTATTGRTTAATGRTAPVTGRTTQATTIQKTTKDGKTTMTMGGGALSTATSVAAPLGGAQYAKPAPASAGKAAAADDLYQTLPAEPAVMPEEH